MPRNVWLQATILSVTVALSLVVGSFITLTVVDDNGTTTATPAATPTNVVATATPAPTQDRLVNGGGVAALAGVDLPEVIQAVTPSVVDIDLLNGNGVAVGGGSGVVVDQKGHILTNWHVVNAATGSIQVNLWDGTAALARVLGADPSNDLAVLLINVDADRLVPAVFANSDDVRIGDVVFAIGSPFDQDFSVTAGIISARGRSSGANLSGIRPNRDLLQSDAAINPGNSGGPLFSTAGEVVGINVSISTTDGDFDGLGFSIPSNTVVRYLPQLIAAEPIVHAQLGVVGITVNEVNAARDDLRVDRGFLVTSVTGGAAAAGIEPGDVITAIGGIAIQDFEDLIFAIDHSAVGEIVPVSINRDGTAMTLDATLQAWAPPQ